MGSYKIANTFIRCGGCSSAITRALNKAKEDPNFGISDFKVDLESQTVVVDGRSWNLPPLIGSASLKDVEAKIAKTGKTIKSSAEI
ncbi:hypothetical protein E3Q23_00827 [Wallemia mellicola]|uniref:HMA domain-containing protein n=1 Tax=Wallemia mellicola TaxID=1708541 RepID=A0A4T0P093_9BASI|nr:hypothetical protein E3Q23_00827 [Wallemia mellicola]TIC03345.1 hypothetical protein E3Q17_00909 [Wallemia mellicola]TIC20984.1 hypothetical protein E3Q13_00058 [Wallemia mellicola]TIC68713.1 hypothetical protein E3Q01_00708 [Wallemia mellicola]TIC71945.1 hypothetical protein E3Q03_00007 [Wallemia mellicola]